MESSSWRPVVALLALPFAFIALATFRPFTDDVLVAASDLLSVLVASLAAVLAFRAASFLAGRTRKAWFTLAAGLGLWGAGEAAWTLYEVVLNVDAPFPSIADVLYLGAYPLMFAGILLLSAPDRGTARLRTLLDSGVVVLALAAPLWVYLLEPIYSASESGTLEKVMTAAYPIGDLIIVFALAVATLRAGAGRRGLVLALLGGGLAAFVATDLVFAIWSLEDEFASGGLLDTGWIAGYTLIAVAALAEAKWRSTRRAAEDDARLSPAVRQGVPTVLLFGLLAWFSFEAAWGGGIDAVTAACVLAAAALVLARNFLSMTDVLAVTAQLNETTRMLADANESLRDKSRSLNALLTEAVDLSRRDSLTGLYNHGSIIEELELATVRDRPVLVAMLDVDYMKSINDTLGHPVGDEILKTLAGGLKGISELTAGRYGGDEFLAFASIDLAEIDDFKKFTMARLASISLAGAIHIEAKVSFGWALSPADGTRAADLIDMADSYLYEAKRLRDYRPHVQRGTAA